MASGRHLTHPENVVLRLHQPVPDEALPAALSSASVLLETTLSHLQLVREDSHALGGHLVIAVSDGTVTLGFDVPRESADAA